MNTIIRILLIVLFVIAPTTSQGNPLDNLHRSFIARYDEANSKRDQHLAKLKNSYIVALERQQEKATIQGNLDITLPWVEEIEHVKTATDQLPPLTDQAPLELKRMRAKLAEGREHIIRSHAVTLTNLADKMQQALKTKESELTKAGEIENAVAAKHFRESLENDQKIIDARDMIKFGGSTTLGRPALQIRRYGDNLEALVHYDRTGKITMNSPILNIRERTDPGRELGNTGAKTLGEFVGAKGYTSHPYLAYNQVFEGGEAPGLSFTEILPTYKTTFEGETALALSFQQGAKNPHINLGNILPVSKVGGRVWIQVKYIIPKENQALEGFHFVHHIGGPIANKRFTTRGQWIEESVEFEVSSEAPTLLLYLAVGEGRSVVEALGDSVFLKEIRIEIHSLPIFLQKRMAYSGTTIEEFNDPTKQPLIVRNDAVLIK